MALYKLEELYPNYRQEIFDGDDIKGLDVYASKTGEKIGSIASALVDQEGRCQYFIIDTGFWVFGKKFLLPVTYCQINAQKQRIYATGIIDKKQVEALPAYNNITRINRRYEERVQKVYRHYAVKSGADRAKPSVEIPTPVEAVYPTSKSKVFALPDSNLSSDRPTLKLHEERLVAQKSRHQSGEVVFSKHIETQKARVSLPLQKERVVIERNKPINADNVAFPENIAFRTGELARMKVYAETPNIRKQAFVREEVKIRKEVEQDIVQAEETLRHEELDIDTQGCHVVNRRRA